MNLAERIKKPVKHSDEFRSPFIIAEAGVNHEGSLDTAFRLIDEAKLGGAHAIKFQTYRAETIASKYSPAYWDTSKEPIKSQYHLFKKYDKFWKPEFENLKLHCDDIGIEFLSTPFDLRSADFLDDLMEVFKISSSDITNKPFIQRLCEYGKPILLSTGASNLDEVNRALSWVNNLDVSVALLHCVLNYPTDDRNANLNMIRGLKRAYPELTIGYSDHTAPGDMKNLEYAALLGAEIIEKHFTHDKTLPGNDHYHAMDKDDLRQLVDGLGKISELMGKQDKKCLASEESARKYARRSLVASKRIDKGHPIESRHLTWKRPGTGVSPADIDKVVGRTALREIKEDEIVTWDMLA